MQIYQWYHNIITNGIKPENPEGFFSLVTMVPLVDHWCDFCHIDQYISLDFVFFIFYMNIVLFIKFTFFTFTQIHVVLIYEILEMFLGSPY